MAPTAAARDYPLQYFLASAGAATINYPLWRASAIGQSGFAVHTPVLSNIRLPTVLGPYVYALRPPYKGAVATVLGMTWARAAIFYGSDAGRAILLSHGWSPMAATVVPPLVVSTFVQCVNMPLVRATVTIQNPSSDVPTVRAAVRQIVASAGVAGLWHGTSAGILKTVPKYCTAVVVKDVMEEYLAPAMTREEGLSRSAVKSICAGVAGAALTNPLDVIRNEMFKTNESLMHTVRHLKRTTPNWAWRGLGKNMIAVAIPVACTIFFTDALIQSSRQQALDDAADKKGAQ